MKFAVFLMWCFIDILTWIGYMYILISIKTSTIATIFVCVDGIFVFHELIFRIVCRILKVEFEKQLVRYCNDGEEIKANFECLIRRVHRELKCSNFRTYFVIKTLLVFAQTTILVVLEALGKFTYDSNSIMTLVFIIKVWIQAILCFTLANCKMKKKWVNLGT